MSVGKPKQIWDGLDSFVKYVDDGRGRGIKSSPCKLKPHKELWMEREDGGFKGDASAGLAPVRGRL